MQHKVSQYFTVLEFYSAFGPVFSSTVVPPVSRLSKWTVNQAVNPWKTPDFSTQKWNWAFISWEMKQRFHHLSSQKFILFVLERFLINTPITSRSLTCRVYISKHMTSQGVLRQSSGSIRWLNLGLVKNSCCAKGLQRWDIIQNHNVNNIFCVSRGKRTNRIKHTKQQTKN